MLKRALRIISVIIGTVHAFNVLVTPALALTVGHSGGKGLSPEVTPGETYIETLSVNVSPNDEPSDILIEILGYKDSDQGIEAVPAEMDTSIYSARAFFQPNKVIIHCDPGETKQAQVQVTVPPNIKSGGRYAVLRFTAIPKSTNGALGVNSAIVLPIQFTIKGGTLIHTAEVTGLTIGQAESGKPIEIFTSLKNTGNHHFIVKGQIEINDSTGRLIDSVFVNSSSPIPEGTRKIKSTFFPREQLTQGTYSAKAILTLEDGTLLGEAIGSFQVEKPYVPPPPPAAVTLEPTSSDILRTDDGRIYISFPQGSVTSEAKISLQNYPIEQLPAPPPDYKLATTCFRVDGLNGLLAKQATLTVKYSSSDLEKAGGDASGLSLARWDEATGKWSVLKTTVDKGNMTLTANTNQFSTWAVTIGQPAATVNWLLLSIVGGVAVLILAGLSMIAKRKR